MVFPDIPCIAAMGHTVDEAQSNAEDALRDYAAETVRLPCFLQWPPKNRHARTVFELP